MRQKAIRLIVVGVLGVLILATSFSSTQPALAQTENQPKIQEPDFSNAILRLEDLPAGFESLSGNDLSRMESALDIWRGAMSGKSEVTMVNVTGFRNNSQVIISALVTQLSSIEQIEIDLAFSNPDTAIQQLGEGLGSGETARLTGYDDIGVTSIGFTTSTLGFRIEYVVARRGPVLIEVANLYPEEGQPLANTIELARLLDDRVAEVVGRESTTTFRPAGPYIPELTTYIPTPLDVSTQPGVIGANLFLAALLMLPFAVAAEVFTRTLGEHEGDLRKKFRPVEWISRLQKRLEEITGTKFSKRPALRDTLKLMGVVIFYGLVFSLLDRTWKPFSLQGLILFLSMTIAYGVVGIADDIIQWRTIRKWGLHADLTVRPTNFLLAMASTTTSRLLSMVPGLMFGTPEALQTEEGQFDEPKRYNLLKISARTFVFIGLGVWLPTIITALLQRLPLSENTINLIGGLEGFLLVIFAVALENLFVQMLGFPGGFGQALKRRNKWLWLAVLTAVTFLFYHTLINPRGELAEALKTGNVRLFLSMVAAFVVVAFGLWIYFRWQERRIAGPSKVTPAPVVTVSKPEVPAPAPLPSRPVIDAPTPSSVSPKIPTAFPHKVIEVQHPTILPTEVQSKPSFVSINETKACPVCCNQIKPEARICRFCKATFAVTIRGYCLTDHDVMETSAEGKCARCGNQVADLHVESRLLKAPTVLPVQVTQAAVAPVNVQTSTDTTGDTKPCPACGQMIKAEARICRFCHTRLG